MDVIEHVAEELAAEMIKKIELKEESEKKIKGLTRGTVTVRKKKNSEFYSLDYYCELSKKGRTKYITKEQAIILQEEVKKRRNAEETLRNTKKDLIILEAMLKAANRRLNKDSISQMLNEIKMNREASEKAVPNKTIKGINDVQDTPPTNLL